MTTALTYSHSGTERAKAYEKVLLVLYSGLDEPASERLIAISRSSVERHTDLLAKHFLWTSTEAYGILKHGVSSGFLVAMSDYLGIGKGEMADLVDLDRSTAYRKVAGGKSLPMHAAETALRLLELTRLAEDTFETPEAAAGWLRRSHPMLNGEAPLDLAKSAYGAERVKEILIAIKYGGAA